MADAEPEHLLGHEEGASVLVTQRPETEHRVVRRPGRSGPLRVRGFTLIELVVTFSLLGLLVALALPSFSAWVQNAKVRAVADNLQTGVRLAQTEAVRLNQPVVLWLTNSTPAAGVSADTNGKNWSMQTIAKFGGTSTFIQGGALAEVASGVAINSSVNSICFNSNGRMVTATATDTGVPGSSCTATGPATFNISQASADRPLRVVVQLGGQVHMCDPNRPALSSTSPDGC
jgi:type IV fimbrial biogenesis protein FimT